MKFFIISIMFIFSLSVSAQAKKSLTWNDKPGEALNKGNVGNDRIIERNKNFNNINGQLTEDASRVQYTDCVNGVCDSKRVFFHKNRYKRVTAESITVGSCFIKQEKDKVLFFKVTKRTNEFIESLVEVYSEKTTKYRNILYRRNFVYNDHTFNPNLEFFPCEETPTLSDSSYVDKCINTKMKQKYFCPTRKFYKYINISAKKEYN